MKRNYRIECANHKRTISKAYDTTGKYLTQTKNWVGSQGAFNVCATEDSEYEGKPIAVTVIISNHKSWEAAETALLKAVEALSADDQASAQESITEGREAGIALQAKIKTDAEYVNRKLKADREKRNKRRLGYIE
jgi:hypothetical protein